MMDQRERRLCSAVVHASVHMKMGGKIAHFRLFRVDGDNGPWECDIRNCHLL